MENNYLKEQVTRLNGGQPIQPMNQALLEQMQMQQNQQQTRLPPISSAKSRQGMAVQQPQA